MDVGVLGQLPPSSWPCECSGCTHGCIHCSSDHFLLTSLKSPADPNSCDLHPNTSPPWCLRLYSVTDILLVPDLHLRVRLT